MRLSVFLCCYGIFNIGTNNESSVSLEILTNQRSPVCLKEDVVEGDDLVPSGVVVDSPLVLPGALHQDHRLRLQTGLGLTQMLIFMK